jgi:hypothetical protein
VGQHRSTVNPIVAERPGGRAERPLACTVPAVTLPTMRYPSPVAGLCVGMMTLYDCPTCALPATATPRGRRQSTHGPVEHILLRCVLGHWFLGPAETLAGTAGTARPARNFPESGSGIVA